MDDGVRRSLESSSRMPNEKDFHHIARLMAGRYRRANNPRHNAADKQRTLDGEPKLKKQRMIVKDILDWT